MPKVVILGGGVAGMSAAHELVERGFMVDVYELKPAYLGGKARSVNVPGSSPADPKGLDSTAPARDADSLPGEHGFRFFPGFYRHITDTMKRIPYTSPKTGKKNGQGVFDNLVDVTRVGVYRDGKTAISTVVSFPKSLADVESFLSVLHTHDTGLKPGEARSFAFKVWQLMTSSQRRREIEYEKIGWWQYMDADSTDHSDAYRTLLVEGLTRTLVAANAKKASTKTGGDIFIQLLFNIANPGMHTDRVLNGPTNEVWLKPWETYLVGKGVTFYRGAKVEKLVFDSAMTRVVSVKIQDWAKNQPYSPLAQGDYYLLATPVETAAIVLPDEVKQHIGSLQHLDDLSADVAWMNGIQFYLNEEIQVVKGHCIYVDSEWALTSISQLPFWDSSGFDIRERGLGNVKTILSVDISDWENPYPTEKHPDPALLPMMAKDCQTFDEVAERVWSQLKRSLNVNGTVLRDDMRLGTYTVEGRKAQGYYLDHSLNEETSPLAQPQVTPSAIDPAASVVGQKPANKFVLVNHEQLLVNTINSWYQRPDAFLPGVSNLFLASDYVRTFTDLATMEGANEAARRAVNAIIASSGQDVPTCKVWNLHEPSFFMPLKWYDLWRYERGMPYGKAPGWLDAIMVGWGIVYAIWFMAFTAWTFVSSWMSKQTKNA
ncbi:hydroxysqualene dehydroxylase [Fibrella aquatica]|uniref:hydroxysqualene dehydroxylase n=1 Tax=Fibrella aquatica TaxID=3242487 RepID=UPI0035207556